MAEAALSYTLPADLLFQIKQEVPVCWLYVFIFMYMALPGTYIGQNLLLL